MNQVLDNNYPASGGIDINIRLDQYGIPNPIELVVSPLFEGFKFQNTTIEETQALMDGGHVTFIWNFDDPYWEDNQTDTDTRRKNADNSNVVITQMNTDVSHFFYHNGVYFIKLIMQYKTNSIQIVKKVQIGFNTVSYTPSAGTYTDNIDVSFYSYYSSDKIYYTIDGTSPVLPNSIIPAPSASVYSGSFPLTSADLQLTSYNVNYIGIDKDGNLIGTGNTYKTAIFNIDRRENFNLFVSFEPTGGLYAYNELISFTISASEVGTIYYTLDGSTPTINSTIYTGPTTANAPVTAAAFVKDAVGYVSPVVTAEYNATAAYLESFSAGVTSLDDLSVGVNITDDGDVSYFIVQETPDVPDVNDPNWTNQAPTGFNYTP